MFEHTILDQNWFDRKRNEFLAAVYAGEVPEAKDIYKIISHQVLSFTDFSENDLKSIYQIQQAVLVFFPKPPATYTKVRKHLAKIARIQTKAVTYVDYDTWLNRINLSEAQQRVMFKSVSSLQLSIGCSIFCRRCNEWALPGLRKHFSFTAAKRLIKALHQAGNKNFALYGASDPLDWRHGEKDMVHLWESMKSLGHVPAYGLLTKIPRGSLGTIEKLLSEGMDVGFSVTARNRQKVRFLEKSVGKKLDIQHDFDELLIPAGLDDDFVSVNSSITDNYGTEITPEGAFMIIPTFTSPLYPTGQCRIPVTEDTPFFLKQYVGRTAWKVSYFKPLKVMDLDGGESHLKSLLKPQIETILLDQAIDETTPPGMMGLSEYFKTYAPEAVTQRKRLLPAVAKESFRQTPLQKKGWNQKPKETIVHSNRRYWNIVIPAGWTGSQNIEKMPFPII